MAFADPSQIPIANVERIEIIKGTGSSAWGSSLGGVINVITKSPKPDQKPQGKLTTSGGWGDGGFWKEVMELSGSSGKFGFLVWGSSLNTDDTFRPHSELLNTKTGAKFNYLFSDTMNLAASLGYTGADMDGFEFKTLNRREELLYDLSYGSVRFECMPLDWIDFSATAKASEQDSKVEWFSLVDDSKTAKTASKNIFTGIDFESTLFVAEDHTVSVGLDVGRDQLDSDMMRHEENLRRHGYYANYLLNLGKRYSINVGGRLDKNEAYGKQFSPSAGLVYHLPYCETDIRASAARAFNAPPLIFKYLNGNPNPDLRAERAPGVYEAGFDTRPVSGLWFKFAGYKAEIKDYVALDTTTWKMHNIGRIRRQGMESVVKFNVLENLDLQGGWALNRVEDRETHRIVQGNGVARVTYNAGLNYRCCPNTNLNIKGTYRFWNEASANKPKDRRFIWDARMSCDLGTLKGSDNSVKAFLGVYNILDTKHWYNQLLPLARRRAEFGMEYSF